MISSLAPHTHTLPIWRATSAACELTPPFAVRMPSAAIMPRKSSGEVSLRTRRTLSPFACAPAGLSALTTEDSREHLLQLIGRHTPDRRLPIDQLLFLHLNGKADCGESRPF